MNNPDPWAWASQIQAAPLSNTLSSQRAPEMQPGAAPQQGPLGMATKIVEARALNKGIDTASDPKAWQAMQNSANGFMGNSSLADAANAGANPDAMTNLMGNTGAFGTAPGAAEAIPSVVAPVAEAAPAVLGAPIGAAATGTAGTAATSGALIGATEAATTAAATTGAAAVTAGAGTTAAVGAGTAAAEAGGLAAMGPIGWGIGAVMLAKQLKIF